MNLDLKCIKLNGNKNLKIKFILYTQKLICLKKFLINFVTANLIIKRFNNQINSNHA